MNDGMGGTIHFSPAIKGWLTSGANPFGLYPYREDVDRLTAAFAGEIRELGGPSDKPWGMYDFALNGPDGALKRIGWPTKPRT